jgi:urea transport system permease protein
MTLAMLGAWYSMAYDMQPFTGGFNGISPPNAFKMLGITFDPYSPLVYWVAVGALALCTIVVKLLLQSKFGVIVQAIRNDAERARFLGYSVSFYQVVVFTLSGIIAAIAGVLWVMIVQYVSPTSLEVTFSISMVIWAALGGRLSLFGAIIGALFVNSVQSYLGDELQATYFVILGAIFVLVVRFLPKGIAGLFETVIGYIPYRRAPSTGVGKAPSAAR